MLRFNPVLFCLFLFCANASAQGYRDDVNRKIDSLRSAGIDTILLYRIELVGSGIPEYIGDTICDRPVYLIWATNGVTNIQKFQECFDQRAESHSTFVGETRQVITSHVFPYLADNFTAVMKGELKPAMAKIVSENGHYFREKKSPHSSIQVLESYLKDTVLINFVDEDDIAPIALLHMVNVNYGYNRGTELAQLIGMVEDLVTELYSTERWFKVVDDETPSYDSVIVIDNEGSLGFRSRPLRCHFQHIRYIFWQKQGKTYCQRKLDCTYSKSVLGTFTSRAILLGNSTIFNFLNTTITTIKSEEIKTFYSGDKSDTKRILEKVPETYHLTINYGEESIEKKIRPIDFSMRVGDQTNVNYAVNNNLVSRQLTELLFETIRSMEQKHLFVNY